MGCGTRRFAGSIRARRFFELVEEELTERAGALARRAGSVGGSARRIFALGEHAFSGVAQAGGRRGEEGEELVTLTLERLRKRMSSGARSRHRRRCWRWSGM